MRKAGRVALTVVLWLLALVAVAAVCAVAWWFRVTSAPDGQDDAVQYTLRVPDGMTVREAATELEQNGIIRSADVLYATARLRLYDRARPFTLKSGVYTLNSGLSLKDVYYALQQGSQEYVTVSIPEGLTIRKTARILEENGVCPADEFISLCSNDLLIASYGIPAQTLEGYLFPDTYFFAPQTDTLIVVRRLVDTFFLRAAQIQNGTPYTPQQLHDIVTLASIVEREYRVASEAPVIASVFANRLREHIGLYSCATIEYIITEVQGKPHPDRITYADLEIDSPYNTYKWAGLTPGPISNPGMTALTAAAHPADTDYYYFVLNDAQAGTHTFSKTFDAHIAAENAASYVSK